VIEFALVLPVFAMLVVGLFSSAMLYDARMQLTHAAREGARYGATIPVDQTFDNGGWADAVERLVRQRLTPDGDIDICVALVVGSPATPVSADHTTRSDGTACVVDDASGDVDRRVQVQLTAIRTLDAVAFSREVTLNADASSRHESHG
jgi:Flp pilus assembly protein TadG